MNEPWYNFFWLYILDLNKNLVEDPRVLKVKSLSPVRMDKIREKILANSMMKVDVKKLRNTTW